MIVKAKRLGWDEQLTPEQEFDLEPYDYESDELVGELEQVGVEASEEHSAISITLVGGQEADPKTIEEVQ